MHKVRKLYVKWEDGDGGEYLILKEDYYAFEKQLERISESLDDHGDEDIYYEQLNDLLDHFSKGSLDGEKYYVVLERDVIDKDELEVE